MASNDARTGPVSWRYFNICLRNAIEHVNYIAAKMKISVSKFETECGMQKLVYLGKLGFKFHDARLLLSNLSGKSSNGT